jgi:hypothetical protein
MIGRAVSSSGEIAGATSGAIASAVAMAATLKALLVTRTLVAAASTFVSSIFFSTLVTIGV